MTKTLLVFRHEISTAFRRRSFLFAVFVLPVILFLAFVVLSRIGEGQPSGPTGSAGGPDTRNLQREGYVDQSGLIQEIHPDVPQGMLRGNCSAC